MDKDKKKTADTSGKKIVDLSSYRKNKTEERRREYERIFFNRVLGLYSFVERQPLKHIEIIDISYSGIRFREENPDIVPDVGAKFGIRFYLTPSSFVRVPIEIKRVTPVQDENRNYMEYGCVLDKDAKSYEIVRLLVMLMNRYSELATQDSNPPLIWF